MKKKLSVFLSLILIFALAVGCAGQDKTTETTTTASGQDGTSTEETTSEVVEVDYSEHETFTAWLYATPNDYYSDYSENPVVQYLNNKFNVTLQYEQPAAGTESDSLSLMFGTGEYTDMIDSSYYTGSASELYDDGVIIDIAKYLDYMPNLKELIETDENFYRDIHNDNGQILKLKEYFVDEELQWGGLVYRRDILETMTGGNIAFPSGNDKPTTIADWDYMLPLFKQYFDAAGMPESAALILPNNGVFATSQLISGFGVAYMNYLDGDEVKFGPYEDGYFNYVKKMNEWYQAGYIYQDFASRTNDLFYLPNTALTYGGAAGSWFGLNSQLGDVMSLPEYNLIMDVQPASSPVDEANGQESAPAFHLTSKTDRPGGTFITSACENIPKLLSVLDYMYSDEGAMMRTYGLTAEQGAAENEYYQAAGMEDGLYWFEGNDFVYNPQVTAAGGPINPEALMGVRLTSKTIQKYQQIYSSELDIQASDLWNMYLLDSRRSIPNALTPPADEEAVLADNNVKIRDYIDSEIPKFIMGTTELTEENWQKFQDQLEAYGATENIEILQAAYDRYLAR